MIGLRLEIANMLNIHNYKFKSKTNKSRIVFSYWGGSVWTPSWVNIYTDLNVDQITLLISNNFQLNLQTHSYLRHGYYNLVWLKELEDLINKL